MDGHPFLTHGTFGVPTLVASVGNNGVLGLALETGFDRLTLLGDHPQPPLLADVILGLDVSAQDAHALNCPIGETRPRLDLCGSALAW